MADHADRRCTPLEDLACDLFEVGALLDEAEKRGWLLADLGQEARARFTDRLAGGTGSAWASADDTFTPVHEDAVDLELVGQSDDVGGKPDRETSDRGQAQHARGHLGGRRDTSASDAPSACRFRTASIIVSVLPASSPPARARRRHGSRSQGR